MDISNLLRIMHQGGYIMYPLLICSILVIAIVIERWLVLQQARCNATKQLQQQYKKRPAHEGQQKSAWLEAACGRIVNDLRQRINYLDTFITLGPLLGLLGTVIGMIQAFSVLNIKAGQPLAITGGIGEALITTASGLIVAILALLGQCLLNNKLDSIISQLEDTANQLLFDEE